MFWREREEGKRKLSFEEIEQQLYELQDMDFDSLPCQVPTSDQGSAGQNPGYIQILYMKCLICDKSFSAKQKQIFEEHEFCHN
ncbi:hypothetical protein QTO34_003973, partial [Cnephaeus nilssonii]